VANPAGEKKKKKLLTKRKNSGNLPEEWVVGEFCLDFRSAACSRLADLLKSTL
jgi:hypothetical protein